MQQRLSSVNFLTKTSKTHVIDIINIVRVHDIRKVVWFEIAWSRGRTLLCYPVARLCEMKRDET